MPRSPPPTWPTAMRASPAVPASASRSRSARRTWRRGCRMRVSGHSPVIALTGREPPLFHHRNTYQELPHQPLYASVTKFSADVDAAADLPRLLRQAWREAMTGSPRPAHLDLYGRSANIVETGMVSEPAGCRSGAATDDAAVSAGAVGRRDRARGGEAARGEADRHRRRRRCRRVGRRPGTAGAGRGTGGADRHLARWARRDPDAASPVDRLPGKLCRAARQPDRARGRPRAVRRLPHRRSGDAHLAHSAARHAGGADRHRSAGTGPQLPEHARPDGRSEGDAGEADRGDRQTAARHVVRRPRRRHRRRLARGARAAARQQRRADPARPAVRRDHPRVAGGRHPGRGHRLFRHLDLDADRTERQRRRPICARRARLAGRSPPRSARSARRASAR